MYIQCIKYIHTIQVNMSSSSICILCIYEDVSPLTHRKYIFLSRNFVSELHDIFKEHNPGIKQELPVHINVQNLCHKGQCPIHFSCCFFKKETLCA
jgi:hypothetical protein